MQHQSQEQPAYQPYQSYTPSEICMPEQDLQLPVYQSPDQQRMQSSIQTEGIIVYPNRKSAIFRAAICTLAMLFLIGAIIGAFVTNGPIQPGDVKPMVLTLVIVLIGSLLLGWLGWRMGFQLLLSPKPMLLLNREGITVGKMLMIRSGFFISWADIEVIYASRIGYKYLCVRPKNLEQFLSRFTGQAGSTLLFNTNRAAPIMIPQMYLDRPVEEILQRLYYMYAHELNHYQVRLQA